MKVIIEWFKNRFLCIKYGKKDCRECKYYYDDGAWWGCNLNQKIIGNNCSLTNYEYLKNHLYGTVMCPLSSRQTKKQKE